MKNTDLKGDKVFPVAFFLHNRKDTETHKAFFDWLFNQIDVPRQVPFVVDREHSIVANLLGHSVGAHQLFYCTIHIRKDVEIWCKKHKSEKKFSQQFPGKCTSSLEKNQ